MKLSWFTPLPPDKTEIGNVSARLIPSLAAAFDLTVYSQTREWDPALDSHCPILPLDAESVDWKQVNLGGIPVYHIGNNIHFHADIIAVARQCPGIVVLHDLAIHETVMNLCLRRGSGRAGYFDTLFRYGGPKAVERGKEFLDQRTIDTNLLSTEYPLYQYVVENARGIIIHNPSLVETLRKTYRGPVLFAPLPYLRKEEMHPPVRRVPREREPYEIIIFGFLGSSNRRLQPFLEAFAKCGEQGRFRITIAGKYDEKAVRGWSRKLGLENSVRLRGFVSDEELDQLLHDSDLCINLRWPSRGEASGTLLRIWNYSLPSMVTNTDYYARLPKGTVALVEPDDEEADIIRHLQGFAENPDPYFAMGIAGRRHLEETQSIEAFIGHLDAFLPQVHACRGDVRLQSFGRRLSRNYLCDYPSPNARSRLMEKCAHELASWAKH